MNTLILLINCLTALISLVSATSYSTTVTGGALCEIDGQLFPLKEATVKVFDDNLIDNLVGEATTDMDGEFSVSGVARNTFGIPNIYVTVIYTYSTLIEKNGILTKTDILKIEGLLNLTRFNQGPTTQLIENLNYGYGLITDDHCRAYVHFYDAIIDYKSRTGQQLPYETLKVITHAIIRGETPYALLDKVYVPPDYPLTLEIAKNELAHTVRHTLDGNLAHFHSDAFQFTYFRAHHCGFKSNEGFAFNEGWAQFWAGSCTEVSYGESNDYTIEGNVANGLRNIQESERLSDSDMVNILKSSDGTIHSFEGYSSAVDYYLSNDM